MKKFVLMCLLSFACLNIPTNAEAQALSKVVKTIAKISKNGKKVKRTPVKPKPNKTSSSGMVALPITHKASEAARRHEERNAQKQMICTICNGKGHKNGVKCNNCNGRGKIIRKLK